MLRFVEGGIGSDKSSVMLKLIRDSVLAKNDVLIIVPDQFSFEYDKNLYRYLGAKLFNSIKVLSFNRLAEGIIAKKGSQRGEYADDNTKLLMMHLAIKKIKKEKTALYYKKQLEKPNFIMNALDIVKDFRQSQISPEQLNGAQNNITGTLLEKISDLNAIYSDYCSLLCENDLKDSLTLISEAAQIADKSGYFAGKVVFVDEFNGFSADEFSMLEAIVKECGDITFSLTIGNGNNSKTKISPFSNVLITEQQLVDMAKSKSIPVSFIRCDECGVNKPVSIRHISNNIFYPIKNKCDSNNDVSIICCNDMYEEAEYISTQIKRLVCDKGYRYSDIAVISRQLSDYYSIIPDVFERYEIPYFLDAHQPVSQKALIIYVVSIFEVVETKRFNTENILKYIKSTLSKFNDIQVSYIEDYCYQWNVNGDMWLSDFTARVDNYNSSEDKGLEKINKIRHEIIKPLQEFKTACQNATGEQICRAFYNLLDDISLPVIISDRIKNGANIISDDGNKAIEIAREIKQLWGVLISAIRSIYDTMKNEIITLKDFADMLKLMLFKATVSTPPQKLDAVIVASAERSRLANPKVVFVIGVNEGIMPYNVKENSLFTEKDKDILEKSGIRISKNILWRLSEERFIAYQALSVAMQKLYISYPLADLTGGARRISPIIKQITSMLGDEIVITAWEKPSSYYCTTLHSTYYKYIENCKKSTSEIQAFKKILLKFPTYKEKINFLEKIQENPQHLLISQTSREMFFKDNLNISPTRCDKYYKCPFDFFCNQGLRLNPVKKVEINPLNRGNIVHACLEKIMTTTVDNKKIYNNAFINLNEADIKKAISEFLIEYKNKALGGDFGKTKRFDFMFGMLEELIFDVVINIQNELKASGFSPDKFEFDLSYENNRFKIELENGLIINLSGKIDRVDVCEKDDKKFVRIIDYKTGQKELDFADLYNGINLQMILYLMALTESDGSYEPAGALYMPAVFVEPEIEREFTADNNEPQSDNGDGKGDKIINEKNKQLRRNGLIISITDDDLLQKLTDKKYVKLKKLNKSNTTLPQSSYYQLQDFAKDKLLQMAIRLQKGDICATPTGKENSLPCKYCDYWAVCGNYPPTNANVITKEDGKILMQKIGLEDDGGDENGN